MHTNTDVMGIDRAARTISVRDLRTGETRTERYDALVLSPGAAPIRHRCPEWICRRLRGRNIPDSRRIRSWIADRRARTAVIVGGGFIGLEMVENLIHRGLSVTVLEKLPQVMPPLDPEVAVPLKEHLIAKGVQLHLGDGLARIDEGADGRLTVVAESGASFPPISSSSPSACDPKPSWPRRPASRSARAVASSSTRRCARQIRTSGLSATSSKCRTW